MCVSGAQKGREGGAVAGGGWHWGQDPERKAFPVGHHPLLLTSRSGGGRCRVRGHVVGLRTLKASSGMPLKDQLGPSLPPWMLD